MRIFIKDVAFGRYVAANKKTLAAKERRTKTVLMTQPYYNPYFGGLRARDAKAMKTS